MFDPVLFLLASILLTLAPGPDIIQVLTRSITQGRRAGIAATLGFASGVFFHTILAVLGIAVLIRSSPLAFGIVKYAGAAYLAYIGLRSLTNRGGFALQKDKEITTLSLIYKQSVIGNVLNPKVTLFFLSFLPQFVDSHAAHVEVQMLVLGAIFMLQTILVFGLIALLSGWIGDRLKTQPRILNRLNFFAGCVFIGLGLHIVWSKS